MYHCENLTISLIYGIGLALAHVAAKTKFTVNKCIIQHSLMLIKQHKKLCQSLTRT